MADVAVTTEPAPKRRHWRHRWPLQWEDYDYCYRCFKVKAQSKKCTVCGKIKVKSRRPV